MINILELKVLLKQMLDIMKVTSTSVQKLATIVSTLAATPGPAPIGAAAAPIVGEIAENIMKDITARIDDLPKILSRVVELE